MWNGSLGTSTSQPPPTLSCGRLSEFSIESLLCEGDPQSISVPWIERDSVQTEVSQDETLSCHVMVLIALLILPSLFNDINRTRRSTVAHFSTMVFPLPMGA